MNGKCKLVGRGEQTNGVVRDRSAQRRAEILVVGQKLFEGDGIENGSRQGVRANLAALLDDGDGDGIKLASAGSSVLVVGFDELPQVQRSAEAGRPGADEEDIHFQSFAFALRHSVSCHRRIERRPPERPLQHHVAVNHRLAGEPVRLQNAGFLQLLAFGPANRRQLVPAAENLHAAGSAGADAAARMHQFHIPGSSGCQQARADFDLHAHVIR